MHPPRAAVPPVCPAIAEVEKVKCSAVEIRGGDGVRLRGWFFEPPVPNGGAVIALHGIAASREQTTGLARLFLSSGYSVLTPDLRGHGESGGIASYGVVEADDVHRWADWLLRSPGISRLYGMGGSLGGSVILQSLDAEPRFRAVIAESAYSDFPSVARERVARSLPSGARWLAETGGLVGFGLDALAVWGRPAQDVFDRCRQEDPRAGSADSWASRQPYLAGKLAADCRGEPLGRSCGSFPARATPGSGRRRRASLNPACPAGSPLTEHLEQTASRQTAFLPSTTLLEHRGRCIIAQ